MQPLSSDGLRAMSTPATPRKGSRLEPDLPLGRITPSPRFFRAVRLVRKQLADAQGLVGYTLRAKPLARDYWTLSVWVDREALHAFMRTPPHVGVMSSLKPLMRPTKFVQ